MRLLSGAGRRLAGVSFGAVVVVFAFFGVYLLVPAAVAGRWGIDPGRDLVRAA
jgi:hypothetical protein